MGAFSSDVNNEGVLLSVVSIDFEIQKWIYEKSSASVATTDKTTWDCDLIETRQMRLYDKYMFITVDRSRCTEASLPTIKPGDVFRVQVKI